MSTTLKPTDLVRLAWTTALRRQGHRKCAGTLTFGPKVCAMGMLNEVAGYNRSTYPGYEALGKLAGLTSKQVGDVIAMNDGTPNIRAKSFRTIADAIDSWFKESAA